MAEVKRRILVKGDVCILSILMYCIVLCGDVCVYNNYITAVCVKQSEKRSNIMRTYTNTRTLVPTRHEQHHTSRILNSLPLRCLDNKISHGRV